MIPEDSIEPVRDVQDADALPDRRRAARRGGRDQAQRRARHVDGHGAAKSLLEVKDGLTFLDVIARQVLALRESSGARLPLVLMNSFYTRDDSLALLERYEELAARTCRSTSSSTRSPSCSSTG